LVPVNAISQLAPERTPGPLPAIQTFNSNAYRRVDAS
jgi:hypothetical protein